MAFKVLCQGYYWPTLHRDTNQIACTCNSCQVHADILPKSLEPLINLKSLWPFAQWGLDLIGLLPTGKRQARYVIMAIDYFTKWIEIEPLATISEKKTTSFIKRNILCRYGIPQVIITDHGKQFDNSIFPNLCADLNIDI